MGVTFAVAPILFFGKYILEKKMKHYLVTGGLGFVGARLIELGLERNHDIKFTILDNFSMGSLKSLTRFVPSLTDISTPKARYSNLTNRISVIKGDIRDKDMLPRDIVPFDAIIHLAANTGVQPSVDNPYLDMETNVQGTMNVLEIARSQEKKPKVIFASSNAPLGEAEQPVSEKTSCRPLSPYGASKLAGEGYMSAYFACFGVPTVALRFGNLYGIGSTHKSSVVAKFIRLALEGKDWSIYGDGSQSRDFLYLDDLIDAIYKAINVIEAGGELFQISGGKETRILDLADYLAEALNANNIERPKLAFEGKRPGDMPKNFANVEKARDVLGWVAKTNLDRGLKLTVDWFLDSRAQG